MRKKWIELVSRLRLGRSGTAEAVHKPLFTLMLLARACRGVSNKVHFKEIDPVLRRAIEEFGPAHRSYSTEYAFWHLQNDGFWVVDDQDVLPRRKGKDRPTRTGLLKYDAKGHVPPDLWEGLTSDPELTWQLTMLILERHWSKTEHAAILNYFGIKDPGT
jgi:putative restriction endonuclease